MPGAIALTAAAVLLVSAARQAWAEDGLRPVRVAQMGSYSVANPEHRIRQGTQPVPVRPRFFCGQANPFCHPRFRGGYRDEAIASRFEITRTDGKPFSMSSNSANRLLKRFCAARKRKPGDRPTGTPAFAAPSRVHVYGGTCQ